MTRACACGCGEAPASWKAMYIRGHRPLRPMAERLWARVDKRGPLKCWEWQGYRKSDGYGAIAVGRNGEGVARTHRAVWEVTNGPVPAGQVVRHSCDNPACCNPAHLSLGTQADNVRDAVERDRFPRGEVHASARFTDEQVRFVREAYRRENGRLCARELAEITGMSQSYVYEVARGEVRQSS